MSNVDNPYRSWGMVAAQAETNERTSFIRQTYVHLTGAIFAFAALEAVLLNTDLGARMAGTIMANQWGWLIVMVAFVGVSWLANSWAQSDTSKAMQYMGLGLYVVAEAVIFLPLLYIANWMDPNVIPTAGVLTLMVFGGLTAAVFMTGADLSFLRTGLMIAGMASIGLIVCSILFGFSLGIVFMVAMIVLASGYILYDTSNVLHHYRIGQHVAASLALFASVALMFWYMVQLMMSLTSRD